MGVATHFPADRGGIAAQFGGDSPQRAALASQIRDHDPFLDREEPLRGRHRPGRRPSISLQPGLGLARSSVPPPLTGPPVDPDDPARLRRSHTSRHKIKISLALVAQLPRTLRRPVLTDLEHCNP